LFGNVFFAARAVSLGAEKPWEISSATSSFLLSKNQTVDDTAHEDPKAACADMFDWLVKLKNSPTEDNV
jgi:hypothetical protein